MKKLLLSSSLILLGLFACQTATEKNSPKEQTENQELKELQVKLNATEAQLLNVRSELAKCKGDSTPVSQVDSL